MQSGNRSDDRIVYSALGVEAWMRAPPTVDAVRPACCPACGSAGSPPGQCLGLHGHGLRERQQWGPPSPDGKPGAVDLLVRRFRCRPCGAVVTVVPRGLLGRRLYSAGAIGLALALLGCAHLPPAEVRRRVSPWRIVGPTAAGRWVTLRRWIAAVRAGALFPGVRAAPAGFTGRQLAERAATTLAARAPPGLDSGPITARAFAGAAYVT